MQVCAYLLMRKNADLKPASAAMQVLEQQPSQRGDARELAPVLRVLQKVPFLAELEPPALLELSRQAASSPGVAAATPPAGQCQFEL